MQVNSTSFLDYKITIFGIPLKMAKLIFYVTGIAAIAFMMVTDFSAENKEYLSLIWRIARNLIICVCIPVVASVLLYAIFQTDPYRIAAFYRYLFINKAKNYEIVGTIYKANARTTKK